MKFELSKAISLLERTPSVIAAMLRDLGSEWVFENEGLDTWSPFDVLGHLIYGEQTDWMVRTALILEKEGTKTFESFDRYAQFERSKGKQLEDLLLEFEELRAKNLEVLKSKNITVNDLELEGLHPELGKVTLAQLLSAWVVHDLGHIAQISRVMAKQYGQEVGPWTKYLTILNHTPSESP